MRLFTISLLAVISFVGLKLGQQHWPQILRVVQQAQNNAWASAAEASAADSTAVAPAPTWTVGYKKDEMTDRQMLQAELEESADGGGMFDITAACSQTGISITVDYFAPDRQPAHYIQESNGQVAVETRFDDLQEEVHSSSTNYNNEAILVFLVDPLPKSGNGLQDFIADLVATGMSAGKPEVLVNSHLLRMRFQLTDGRTPIVALDLQDRSLQDFFSRCGFPSPGKLEPFSPAKPTEANSDIRYMIVSTQNLNLRDGPGTNYAVITRMPEELRVKLIGPAGDGWLELEVPVEGGTTVHGFANSAFLRPE